MTMMMTLYLRLVAFESLLWILYSFVLKIGAVIKTGQQTKAEKHGVSDWRLFYLLYHIETNKLLMAVSAPVEAYSS